MSDRAGGPIILWLDFGCEGWKPYSFPTIEEALKAERYGCDFVLTRPVKYEITETE